MDTPYLQTGETYLLLADNLTELVAGFIDACLLSGNDLVVATSNKAFREEVGKSMGLACFYLPTPSRNDNKIFFDDNMPGSMEDLEVDGFQLWKGLAIDRLRFWQLELNLLKKFIEEVSYTKVAIEMNPMSSLSAVFDSLQSITILKSDTLRTPEIVTFLQKKSDEIDCVITDSEIDTEFIFNYVNNAKVWRIEEEYTPPDKQKRIEKLIYYDKQYIWQFNEFVENWGLFDTVSFDKRSQETFPLCHPGLGEALPPETLPQPVELIMFSYDEQVIKAIKPEKITIFDPYGVNKAKEMSAGDTRVVLI